jgi:hypothetical protein
MVSQGAARGAPISALGSVRAVASDAARSDDKHDPNPLGDSGRQAHELRRPYRCGSPTPLVQGAPASGVCGPCL